MPLPSIIHTENHDFIGVVDHPSFRNHVTQGSWKGRPAYRKRYPELEYWQTELDVLEACAQSPTINVPTIYHSARASLQTIMSEVAGESLMIISAPQIVKLAEVLRAFHVEQDARNLTRLDVHVRVQRFEDNIGATPCLGNDQKDLVQKCCEVVKDELVCIADNSSDLVHGDFNLGNVLYDQATDQFSFIDFERSYIGLGLMDVAKGAWRILHNQSESVDAFLYAYYGRKPTSEERRVFLLSQLYEYLGAISYFALEGHRNGYPYKDEACNQLAQCLSQL